MKFLTRSVLTVTLAAVAPALRAQGAEVSALVVVQSRAGVQHTNDGKGANSGDVVVWLTPLDGALPAGGANPQHRGPFRLVQKNKQFTPHLLVVPAGSSVDFPNRDPFFHNVFSLFNGKRFDLGLYESGTSKAVRFDREGVSYIFCNIHPEMGAVVLALATPYYDVSSADGAITIHSVPAGNYRLHVWSEVARATNTTDSESLVHVGASSIDLGRIVLEATPDALIHHKNKFGEDYLPEHHSAY